MTRGPALVAVLALIGSLASAGDRELDRARIEAYKALPEAKKRELRERWRRFQEMDPELRERLRDRFRATHRRSEDSRSFRRKHEHFQGLDEDKRRLMRRKHEHMRRVLSGLLDKLPAEERARIDALPADEKRAAVNELFKAHMIERKLNELGDAAPEMRAELAGRPFEEQLDLLRKACHKRRPPGFPGGPGGPGFHGPGDDPAFGELFKRLAQHREAVEEAMEASRAAGEDEEARFARIDALLAGLEPEIAVEARQSFVRKLVRFGRGRGGPRGGPGRGGPRGGPGRGGPRGPRPEPGDDRGERGERPERGDRGERPERGGPGRGESVGP